MYCIAIFAETKVSCENKLEKNMQSRYVHEVLFILCLYYLSMYQLNHIHLNLHAREEDGLGTVAVDETEVVGTKR